MKQKTEINAAISPLMKEKYLPEKGETVLFDEGRCNSDRDLYRHTYPKMAFKFVLLGATCERLAELFNISTVTIAEWQKKYPVFKEAILDGREAADANVAEAMYTRACGYSQIEQKVNVVEGSVVVTDILKHYPPDVNAGKFWLANRQADNWRFTPEIEITANLHTYEPMIKRFDGSTDDDDEEVTIIEMEKD